MCVCAGIHGSTAVVSGFYQCKSSLDSVPMNRPGPGCKNISKDLNVPRKTTAPTSIPVRIMDTRADHLHGPLPYATGADVPPQRQVQDQPQRAGQGTGEHYTNLGQPGESGRQLEAITGAQDVRKQFSQEENQEPAGENCRDDGAQDPVEEDTEGRVSQDTQEEQGAGLGGETGLLEEVSVSSVTLLSEIISRPHI